MSELNADGSTLLSSTYLGGTQRRSETTSHSTRRQSYVTGHTYSTRSRRRRGAFDTVWNGDLAIFWGDAFVPEARSVRRLPQRRRSRLRLRCPRRPTARRRRSRLLSSGTSRRGPLIHDSDRRFERVWLRRSCASSRASRTCGTRLPDWRPSLTSGASEASTRTA